MIDQTEEIEACLHAFSKYWKSGTFFTPCSQRSHVGTSTETSSNLLPKVQILTCSFFCMKDWRFSFVRVDSNLGQLQINIDISRPIFSALKPVKSAILYPRPYLNQDIQKYFFFTDRCDDMCSKRKTSLHSHAKRGTDQNQLLKSCSHMGTLGGKRLKKLNSMERGALKLFNIFASPRWSPLRMRTKVVSFFIFFQELSNKKKLRLYDQRWLK